MNNQLLGVYAVKHRNDEIRSLSRSGGIFTAISDLVLNRNGIIYGCILDRNFDAIHVRAINKETRDLMRGSKYIQSKLGATFVQVKKDLDDNREVLFTGTSCQIAGLKGFLGKEYSNLLCIDIVCHGTPSPVVWHKYLKWQEEKASSTVYSVDFRNKIDFGWAAHIETLYMLNGQAVSSEVFKNLFYGHNILRPSCYECPYKSIFHPGDITIADYWGIEKAAPGFDDNKGVSLVLINTQKGESYFQPVLHELFYTETNIDDSLQPPLKAPFNRPKTRDAFWKDLNCRSFDYIARTYADYGRINRIKHFVVRVCRKGKKLVKGFVIR